MLFWFTPIPLGYLPRLQRAELCDALQRVIHADLRDFGALPRLSILGTALGYCGSLLRAVPLDPAGDQVEILQARLSDSLRMVLLGVQAGLRRAEVPAQRAALAALLQRLLPLGGPEEPMLLARALLFLVQGEGPAALRGRPLTELLSELGLQGELARLRERLDAVELAEALCEASIVLSPEGAPLPGMHLETALRARHATRFADVLIHQLVGFAQSLEEQPLVQRGGHPRERALRLLRPLWELSLAGVVEGEGTERAGVSGISGLAGRGERALAPSEEGAPWESTY